MNRCTLSATCRLSPRFGMASGWRLWPFWSASWPPSTRRAALAGWPRPRCFGMNDRSTFLSQLLFYSAAISASKRVPSTGYKYARGVKDWPDDLYHYRASSHTAEQRALGDFVTKLTDIDAPIVFVLTSIAWREAWK